MRHLREATADFAAPGDPVLALLCETAFETLTDLNHPDGDCAFCLTPVVGDPNDPAAPFMKLIGMLPLLPHRVFRDWWRWKTAAAEADDRARGPRHPVGSEEAARAPTHLCPVCRVPIEEEDVRHVRLEDETDASANRGDESRLEPGSASPATRSPRSARSARDSRRRCVDNGPRVVSSRKETGKASRSPRAFERQISGSRRRRLDRLLRDRRANRRAGWWDAVGADSDG